MQALRPFVDRPMTDAPAADRVASLAASRWDLPPPIALRRGMNALYSAGRVVLRVGHATADPTLAHELVDRLREWGVPTVVPVTGATGVFDGIAVSGWELIEPNDVAVDWHAVGRAVRRVHDLPLEVVPDGYPCPDPAMFPWWDFDALVDDVGGDIDVAARDGLRRVIERHRGWAERAQSDPVLCHGDVHPGNVMMTPDGPLLIDWDLLCRADRGWDHAMLTTFAARWGGRLGTYEAFAAGYGDSLADDPLTQSLAELRNVAATLMRVRAARREPAAAAEAERRLRYWRGDPTAPVWSAQ